MTGLDLISASLRRIGSLGQGETPNGAESQDALLILNNGLIDPWNADRQNIYSISDLTYQLSAGTGKYAIGSTAAPPFNSPRPNLIQSANIIATGTTQNPLRCPLNVVDAIEWGAIEEKGLQDIRPLKVYCDYAYPVATISVWPVPSQTCQIELFAFQPNVPQIFAQDYRSYPPKATEVQAALNKLMAEWAMVSGVALPAALVFSLAAGKGTYLMGPGAADFNTARPLLLQSANALIVGPVRFPLEISDAVDWATVQSRGASGVRPIKLYCDYAYPNANLNLWPVPSNGATLELFSWVPLTPIALSTVLAYPPAYIEALRLNLALKICVEWGTALDPELPGEAAQALAAMRALNAQNLVAYEGARTSGELPNVGTPRQLTSPALAPGLPVPPPPPQVVAPPQG